MPEQPPPGRETDIAAVAALQEPVRRDLYRYVAGRDEPVTREQAAAGTGVARHTVKFHLDRLVADGLLEVEYRRPPGRSGPGAGRPAKVYRPAAREISISLPARRYDLAASVLASAVASVQQGERLPDALHRAARKAGRSLADDVVPTGPAAVERVLSENGYEPRAEDAGFVLTNCPFHSLAAEHTELVCGLNVELLAALLERVAPQTLQARLEPQPGRCCVVVAPLP